MLLRERWRFRTLNFFSLLFISLFTSYKSTRKIEEKKLRNRYKILLLLLNECIGENTYNTRARTHIRTSEPANQAWESVRIVCNNNNTIRFAFFSFLTRHWFSICFISSIYTHTHTSQPHIPFMCYLFAMKSNGEQQIECKWNHIQSLCVLAFFFSFSFNFSFISASISLLLPLLFGIYVYVEHAAENKKKCANQALKCVLIESQPRNKESKKIYNNNKNDDDGNNSGNGNSNGNGHGDNNNRTMNSHDKMRYIHITHTIQLIENTEPSTKANEHTNSCDHSDRILWECSFFDLYALMCVLVCTVIYIFIIYRLYSICNALYLFMYAVML